MSKSNIFWHCQSHLTTLQSGILCNPFLSILGYFYYRISEFSLSFGWGKEKCDHIACMTESVGLVRERSHCQREFVRAIQTLQKIVSSCLENCLSCWTCFSLFTCRVYHCQPHLVERTRSINMQSTVWDSRQQLMVHCGDDFSRPLQKDRQLLWFFALRQFCVAHQNVFLIVHWCVCRRSWFNSERKNLSIVINLPVTADAIQSALFLT